MRARFAAVLAVFCLASCTRDFDQFARSTGAGSGGGGGDASADGPSVQDGSIDGAGGSAGQDGSIDGAGGSAGQDGSADASDGPSPGDADVGADAGEASADAAGDVDAAPADAAADARGDAPGDAPADALGDALADAQADAPADAQGDAPADAQGDGPTICDSYQGVVYQGHCYYAVATAADHATAELGCPMPGSHLVTITSSGEQATAALVSSTVAWIGLSEPPGTYTQANEANFRWVTGEPYTPPSSYNKWAPSEPRFPALGDCVVMRANGQWACNDCAQQLPFICERDF